MIDAHLPVRIWLSSTIIELDSSVGRVLDPAELGTALELPLVPSWRRLVERRLASRRVEDWGKRIDGPPAA